MRRSVAVAVCLLLASCGPGQRRDQGTAEQSVVAEAMPSMPSPPPARPPEYATSGERYAPSGGPSVAVTAAPGVAFNYRYAVRLEAERIAAVMEQHAAFCERQGVNVCRIVGMQYQRHGDGDITGRLSVKLAPNVARQYGQRGVQAVIDADGMLVESEISGTDVTPTIRSARRAIEEADAQLSRVEARLRQTNLRPYERERLEAEAERLRATIRAGSDTHDEAQASLAQTPLTFQYGSGDSVPGYGDDGLSMRDAASRAKNNFLQVLAGIMIVLVTLLPFAALGALGWLLFLWLRRLWRRAAAKREAELSVPVAPDA